MKQTCRAVVLEAPGRLTVRELPVPDVGPDDALLRIELAGVSGTDYQWYRGIVHLPMPIILGHQILGRIARIGERAAGRYHVDVGDRVVVQSSIRCEACEYCIRGDYQFCENRRSYGTTTPVTVPPGLWGAYAEYLYLAPGSLVHKIGEVVPAEVAVMTCAVIANTIGWVRQIGQVSVGDTVVVQGVGQEGLAAVVAARESGAALVVATGLSRDAERFVLARELGAHVTVDVEWEDPVEVVRDLTRGRMADVVVELSGSPRAIVLSIDLVRKMGTIVQAGLTHDDTGVTLPVNRIAFKQIRFQGVLTHQIRYVLPALRLIESGRYPLHKLVTHRFPMREAEQALLAVGGEVPGEYPIKAVLRPEF